MDSTEKVAKHLEMTQTVINRLGSNSFLLKGWSMTIIVSAVVLMARHDVQHPCLILSLIIPILGFWILDGYFLRQERLFREIYDDIRRQSDTDFKMDVMKHKNKPKCNPVSAMFSFTLVIFYLAEVALIVFVFFITPGEIS
ncbi:MAG: hypothetical protein OXB94_07265 [Nitrospira sp.]|nr:hypothetical protein [Nitrospira sp.]